MTGFGWGGGKELQCYTGSPRNVATDGQGHLVITARREASCGGAAYSSARIESRGRGTAKYGYIEIRAKLPTGAGAFPAFWLLGINEPQVHWPKCGEIDVVEALSSGPTVVRTNVHGVDAAGNAWEVGWGHGGLHDVGVNLADAYHTYGIDWTSQALRFSVDGRPVQTVTRASVPVWLWDQAGYFLLNVAIASAGPDSAYPQTMTVDYLRVYAQRP
jgi:beta-glucanase (GH16 family)